jgi:hypothetical protein
MTLQGLLSDFMKDLAATVEEYQIQCQAMGLEAENAKQGQPNFPVFNMIGEVPQQRPREEMAPPAQAVPKRFASLNIITEEEIRAHSPDWVDEQLVLMAGKTKRPLGDVFMKKMRYVFPSLDRSTLKVKIERLMMEGKIPRPEVVAAQLLPPPTLGMMPLTGQLRAGPNVPPGLVVSAGIPLPSTGPLAPPAQPQTNLGPPAQNPDPSEPVAIGQPLP